MSADAALARAVGEYYRLGWRLVPVVIDPQGRRKMPADAGTTGEDGRWLDPDEVVAGLVHWRGTWPGIGVRPEPGVVGIDVDAYDGKVGGRVVEDLRESVPFLGWTGLGALPPTWSSTARRWDPVSGIRWYRYDAARWNPRRDAGDDVDVIRWNHRFAVVSPTVHPGGWPYRWRDPRGAECPPPWVSWLPELPDPWLAHISAAPTPIAGAEAGLLAELTAAGGWLAELAAEAAAGVPKWLEGKAEGGRNWALYGAAKDLIAAGLPTDELERAAAAAGLGTSEIRATIKSAGKKAGK